MIRKHIYKWHRTCSIIIAIPVLLWAISGFMHPIMTNFRPRITTQEIAPVAIDSGKIKVSLQSALKDNHVDSFNSFRLINIDTNWFYQVKVPQQNVLLYLSTSNGKKLSKGDWLYAQYLARIFLEGDKNSKGNKMQEDATAVPDCCNTATACVLNNVSGAKVKDVKIISSFNNVYQGINRMLPVYQVAFEREDGISIYVETAHSRFAFAADNKRVAFNTFFSLIHTWQWIEFFGKGKLVVEVFFSGLAFLTALMGIYIFFITKRKKANGNDLVKTRNRHRYISISVSLFTLMFTFSGCYHAFSKLTTVPVDEYIVQKAFASDNTTLDINKIQSAIQQPIQDVSLVRLDTTCYWQAYIKQTVQGNKDLMKDMKAAKQNVLYINANDYSVLVDGDLNYAKYLAGLFSKQTGNNISSATLTTAFDDEYNFADKLLPVWKIVYTTNHNQRYYIETSTGRLSKQLNDNGNYEGMSFAILHKHEFLGGFGKGVKDFSTMFWAAAQIIMVTIGLILYFKWRKKNKLNNNK